MATFVVDIIRRCPPLTHLRLVLGQYDFESNDCAAICSALTDSSIVSLTEIYLSGNLALFDTDTKCIAWANVLKKQSGLAKLFLLECSISARN